MRLHCYCTLGPLSSKAMLRKCKLQQRKDLLSLKKEVKREGQWLYRRTVDYLQGRYKDDEIKCYVTADSKIRGKSHKLHGVKKNFFANRAMCHWNRWPQSSWDFEDAARQRHGWSDLVLATVLLWDEGLDNLQRFLPVNIPVILIHFK